MHTNKSSHGAEFSSRGPICVWAHLHYYIGPVWSQLRLRLNVCVCLYVGGIFLFACVSLCVCLHLCTRACIHAEFACMISHSGMCGSGHTYLWACVYVCVWMSAWGCQCVWQDSRGHAKVGMKSECNYVSMNQRGSNKDQLHVVWLLKFHVKQAAHSLCSPALCWEGQYIVC